MVVRMKDVIAAEGQMTGCNVMIQNGTKEAIENC